MKKIAILLAAGLAAATLSACATDELAESRATLTADQLKKEAAMTPVAVGTVFNFKINDRDVPITITKVDGISLIDQNGRDFVGFTVGLGREMSETMEASDRAKVATLFPLKVGKKASFSHSGVANSRPWTNSDTAEVVTIEKVTMPAGTFETFVIRTDMGNPNWWGQNTCWYAPEVGSCVKRKWRSATSASDWELVSVKTP